MCALYRGSRISCDFSMITPHTTCRIGSIYLPQLPNQILNLLYSSFSKEVKWEKFEKFAVISLGHVKNVTCVCVCMHTRTHMCWVMPDSATPWTVAPSGSSVHQTRILEWLPSSRGSSHPEIKSAYPASPGLSGRLFTTVAPGKPPDVVRTI